MKHIPDDCYTPKQIARECDVTPQLVTRHLRATMADRHYYRQWWRLSADEYESVCATLKSAKLACPKQPLHALEVPQKFIIFS